MTPCDLSAVEARRLIGTRRLSPVELLESCLERIERVNGQVNGVVALDAERAMTEARQAERRVMAGEPLPPLHGLPVGIKDLIDTAGLRTTYGTPRLRDNVPETDHRLVARLRQAGAIVQMKTNTPEWGAGGNTFNPVYGVSGNPFRPALTCGGSSGGSAIALATGMLPLAHGSDNAGSLRIPASFCGVVGMRPTAGLVPWEERPIGLSHLFVQGPMARTVADTALLLDALASHEPRDPLAVRLEPGRSGGLARSVDTAGLRVAASPDLGGFAHVDSGIAEVFEARIATISGAFHSVARAAPALAGADRVYDILRGVGFVGTHQASEDESPDSWGRLVAENLTQVSQYGLADVGAAYAEHSRLHRAAQDFFEQFDLLITPTVAVSPWPKHGIHPATIGGRPVENYFDWVRLTYAITVLNHPSISIPCGVDRHGLPFGLQLVAPHSQDARLLDVAAALESLFQEDPSTTRPVPNVEWLSAQAIEDPLARPVL